MSYRDWPTELKGNMFELADLDPEKPPTELTVNVWSNVFGKGGDVAIDALVEGERVHGHLAAIEVDRNGVSISDEREHLQSLIDDWNEDAAGNWRALILDAKSKVRAYYEKQVKEATEKLAALDAEVSA